MRAQRKPWVGRGFTLIELMIVVSIIGILAAVAIPKFAELIRKSQEGRVKGSLGAIRSALTIYYSDMEGHYPTSLASLTITGKYVSDFPQITAAGYHLETSSIYDNTTDGCNMIYTNDRGGWVYWSDDGAMCPLGSGGFGGQRERYKGEVWIGCTHTDSRGSYWTAY